MNHSSVSTSSVVISASRLIRMYVSAIRHGTFRYTRQTCFQDVETGQRQQLQILEGFLSLGNTALQTLNLFRCSCHHLRIASFSTSTLQGPSVSLGSVSTPPIAPPQLKACTVLPAPSPSRSVPDYRRARSRVPRPRMRRIDANETSRFHIFLPAQLKNQQVIDPIESKRKRGVKKPNWRQDGGRRRPLYQN
ncbi:hypothetical protein J6590_050112 [Homalodisca vitripennis]|nr:hypothetical protein J6590_050112 [Homalodisca vitripennis]